MICTSTWGNTIRKNYEGWKVQIEEPVAVNTYTVSPRGRDCSRWQIKFYRNKGRRMAGVILVGLFCWATNFKYRLTRQPDTTEVALSQLKTHATPQGPEFISWGYYTFMLPQLQKNGK